MLPRLPSKDINANPTLQNIKYSFCCLSVQDVSDTIYSLQRCGGEWWGVIWAMYFYFYILVQTGKLVFHCQINQEHIYYLTLFEIISTMFKVSIKSIKFFQAHSQNNNTNINCISCSVNISLCEYRWIFLSLSHSHSLCLCHLTNEEIEVVS